MITAAQCRSARTLLTGLSVNWGAPPSVPANVIDSFEMERQRPDAVTIGALQRAFEGSRLADPMTEVADLLAVWQP